jgi:hypothetical protein
LIVTVTVVAPVIKYSFSEDVKYIFVLYVIVSFAAIVIEDNSLFAAVSDVPTPNVTVEAEPAVLQNTTCLTIAVEAEGVYLPDAVSVYVVTPALGPNLTAANGIIGPPLII